MNPTPSNGIALAGQEHSALISGAEFADLSAAWWLRRLGYSVTVVEVSPGLRKGGTPVDIREDVIDCVRRMGLLERIAANGLPPRATDFLDCTGASVVHRPARYDRTLHEEAGWEIERDLLLELLFGEVKDDVEFLFGDSIASLQQHGDRVDAVLASGGHRSFSLVLGCDGTHSAVRRMCFGQESEFSVFLENYFSLTIVEKLLLPENSSQMFNLPGRTVMLNTYNGKTDIAFCFAAPQEIDYDRRNRQVQKQLIHEHLNECGWRVPELLDEMTRSDSFYFDKLCQIRMASWSSGRVVLVGDAGYCPSPAAGMGGSMAILGATALADALAKHPESYSMAFAEYDRSLRPAVERIQTNAIEFGLKMFAPRTEEELRERNALFQS